jgi:hypothetical protein
MSRFREQNNNWRGGKSVASNGYVLVRVGKDHHLSDVRGYAYEHRLVAESKLGRRLEAGEIPHHINGVKTDNRPENIQVVSCVAEHRSLHRSRKDLKQFGASNPIIRCACGCGEWFNAYDGSNRPRKFVSGHNPHDISKQSLFLIAAGNGSTIHNIAARTGQSLVAVKVMASKLVQQNKLTRKGRGIYGS